MNASVWVSSGLVTISLLAVGIVRVRHVIPDLAATEVSFGHLRSTSDSLAQILADAEGVTTTNDLFRLANAPSGVRYDPNNEGGVGGVAAYVPPPVRPNLVLKAIVGGPPWQAMVDGIPGQPSGTVVRVGSTFDKLVAREVTRDSVVMRGPDTTWVLTFRRRP